MTVVFDDYLEALLSANTSAATELLDDALMRGTSPVSLIRDIIGRGQQEIGESWARGSLSLGEEHAATAVSEQALAVVSQSLPASPRGKRVALACAEGEWHTMPARLAGAQARAAGLQVTMLGASLPADQLQAHLLRTAPDVLALSVTLSSNLVGASKSIQAAHRAGVAVIVGGPHGGRTTSGPGHWVPTTGWATCPALRRSSTLSWRTTHSWCRRWSRQRQYCWQRLRRPWLRRPWTVTSPRGVPRS